jgi:hypothetical protein
LRRRADICANFTIVRNKLNNFTPSLIPAIRGIESIEQSNRVSRAYCK